MVCGNTCVAIVDMWIDIMLRAKSVGFVWESLTRSNRHVERDVGKPFVIGLLLAY